MSRSNVQGTKIVAALLVGQRDAHMCRSIAQEIKIVAALLVGPGDARMCRSIAQEIKVIAALLLLAVIIGSLTIFLEFQITPTLMVMMPIGLVAGAVTGGSAYRRKKLAELERLRPHISADAYAVIKDIIRGRARGRIERPPGHRASAVLRLVVGPRAFERVFGQILRDAQEEWIEAARAGDQMELRRVKLYTPVHLLVAATLYPLVRLAKMVDILRKVLPASPVKKD